MARRPTRATDARASRPVTRPPLLALAATLLVAAVVGCSTSAPSSAPSSVPVGAASAPAATASAGTVATGFATPEDAIRAYIAGVAAADADAVLAASAVDDASAHFDFTAQAERLKLLQPIGNPGPAQYPFYARVNHSYFSERLLSQAQALSYSLLASSPISANPAPANGPAASAFAQQVDPARLAGLQVVDIKPPNASVESDPKYRANSLAQAAVYGATDDAQRVALLALGGSNYEVGFELLKYGDTWKVLLQNSSVAGLPATGVAVPITQDQFDQQTAGH